MRLDNRSSQFEIEGRLGESIQICLRESIAL